MVWWQPTLLIFRKIVNEELNRYNTIYIIKQFGVDALIHIIALLITCVAFIVILAGQFQRQHQRKSRTAQQAIAVNAAAQEIQQIFAILILIVISISILLLPNEGQLIKVDTLQLFLSSFIAINCIIYELSYWYYNRQH